MTPLIIEVVIVQLIYLFIGTAITQNAFKNLPEDECESPELLLYLFMVLLWPIVVISHIYGSTMRFFMGNDEDE